VKTAAPVNETDGAPWRVPENSATCWPSATSSWPIGKPCFVVKDSSWQKLGYFYYKEEPDRRSVAKMLSKDEPTADRSELEPAGAINRSPP
jgi:hypothetical protein